MGKWSSAVTKEFNQGAGVRLRCTWREGELFAIKARSIWLRRNDVVHGGCLTHPSQVLSEAMTALEDLQRANGGKKHEEGPLQEQGAILWKPPPFNMVKINWDATLDKQNQVVGLGIVARDGAGRFLSDCSIKKWMMVLPIVAKVVAAFHTMLFAKEKGFMHVIFEGDALTIVNDMNSNHPCESSHGHCGRYQNRVALF